MKSSGNHTHRFYRRFPGKTAYIAYFNDTRTYPFTISGTAAGYNVVGSGSLAQSGVISGTFEGVAALPKTSTVNAFKALLKITQVDKGTLGTTTTTSTALFRMTPADTTKQTVLWSAICLRETRHCH